MPHSTPHVSQLISDPELKDDEQRWERIVQLFRPGIQSWLRKYTTDWALMMDREPDATVDELFIHLKPSFMGHLSGSTVEFSTRLTRAMSERLRFILDPDHSADTDTQSLKLSGSETASVGSGTDGISSERLLALLPELTETTRAVAAMRCIEGLKYREIAERIGIEVSEAVQLDREAQFQLLSLVQPGERVSGDNRDQSAAMAATIDRDNRQG